MERTTFVWVSFSEENLKLLIYPMFHGFLLAQKMVNLLPLLMLLDQLYFIISSVFHSACADCLHFRTNFYHNMKTYHTIHLIYIFEMKSTTTNLFRVISKFSLCGVRHNTQVPCSRNYSAILIYGPVYLSMESVN